jgi:hypothetical protein
MAHYTRALFYRFPLLRGDDVLDVQRRLRDLGYRSVGQPDGLFGNQTEEAVRRFQQANDMKVDGIVGPRTWTALFQTEEDSLNKVRTALEDLMAPHAFRDSATWQLTHEGIVIDGAMPETFGGEPETVRRIWLNFSASIEDWAHDFGVPVELLVATICTESSGDPSAVREEPGYVSDQQTPNKVSPGLMQTLISTAREALGEPSINRAWLLQPDNSIRAGTAYIALQWKETGFDPPKVACAYNAGRVVHNGGAENRWKMRQYPINTGHHADRFVKWFNECMLMFKQDDITPPQSFYALLRGVEA